MSPPIEPHWVCESCGQDYAAQPIVCECGARVFQKVTLDVGGTSVGVEFKVGPRVRVNLACKGCDWCDGYGWRWRGTGDAYPCPGPGIE